MLMKKLGPNSHISINSLNILQVGMIIYRLSFDLKRRSSRKKQMAVKIQSSFMFLVSLSTAATSDFHILELFLSYARAIPLLDSSSCMKDTDDDCISFHISNTSQIIRD